MKRNPKDVDLFNIRDVKPIFWKRCIECGNEYKKEIMWRVTIYSGVWRHKNGSRTEGYSWETPIYICRECYPTIESAGVRCREACKI